ncbi:hypothetical protein [Pyruvatibacter mobilis]|uniref:hypothetical protein n=1 Tax=Pyruvatibacter mobilis TaxID=1712261 RepID=UPI003BACD674
MTTACRLTRAVRGMSPAFLLAATITAIVVAILTASMPARGQDYLSAPVPDSITTKYGETRAYFSDWLAICTPGEDACRTVTYAGDVGHVGDFQLFLHSGYPGMDYQLMFVPVKVMADVSQPITLSVDGEMLGAFSYGADDGYYQDGNVVNEFTFGQSRANLDVIPAMTAGQQLELAFTDETGKAQIIPFSLIGLTKAMMWMDAFRAPGE